MQAFLYTMGRYVLRSYTRLMFQLDVDWQTSQPKVPTLIVSNHPSATDPFCLAMLFQQPITILISENAFAVPIFGDLLRRSGQIPVDPTAGSIAMKTARKRLADGRSVVIFPEGTFSPRDGGFLHPRTGAARLVLQTGVPVLPIGIYLPRERMRPITSGLAGIPTTGNWYFRGPYALTVGKPLHFEGDLSDQASVKAISETIMQRIISLAEESERRMKRGHSQSPGHVL